MVIKDLLSINKTSKTIEIKNTLSVFFISMSITDYKIDSVTDSVTSKLKNCQN